MTNLVTARFVERGRRPDNVLMSKAKSRSRVKKKKSGTSEEQLIVIDEKAGLIFESEKELSAYFEDAINGLESEYQSLRSDEDFTDEEQVRMEGHLEEALDAPDEIWRDEGTLAELALHHYIKDLGGTFYIAVTYVATDDESPTFVLTHFPTRDPKLLQNYQRGEMIYSRLFEEAQPGAIDGDALIEGDPLAIGLYTSMLKLRGEKDIPTQDFHKFADVREETIESADEIWRKTDLNGNVLVIFIKEFPDHESVKELSYIAVTQEDPQTNVHSLLFSFPTNDPALVDRYRQGENLQAEEISQESSH